MLPVLTSNQNAKKLGVIILLDADSESPRPADLRPRSPQPADLRPRAQLVQYFHSRAGTWNPVGFLCVPINTWWPGLYDANHNGKANKNINTGTTSIITTSLDINDCKNLECERSRNWFKKIIV